VSQPEPDSGHVLTCIRRTLNNDKPGESLVETLNLKGDRYNLVVAIFFMWVVAQSTAQHSS
jgi:hypothetical protein